MDNEKTHLEKKSRNSEQSLELLEIIEEIIEEILSRLPAKSLLRFRCVSKSWSSLIGKKLFIKNHLQNITKNETYAHWGVIYNCTEHGLKQCSMQSYLDEPSVDPSPFDDPKNNHLLKGVCVVGHCNGLLCILKHPGCFFLWNPTTRISFELPKLEPSVTTKYGFGWDERSDAYKVFVVVSDQEQNIGKVYSTKTNSWKTVECGCLSLGSSVGRFASGKIHWLKEGGLQIETFDLNSEVFGMMDNPCKPEVGVSMWLYEDTEGCLNVACKRNNYDNQTSKHLSMKLYGVKESWVELITQPDKKSTCCKVAYLYIESLVSPVI